jgi:hypothetical protein
LGQYPLYCIETPGYYIFKLLQNVPRGIPLPADLWDLLNTPLPPFPVLNADLLALSDVLNIVKATVVKESLLEQLFLPAYGTVYPSRISEQ